MCLTALLRLPLRTCADMQLHRTLQVRMIWTDTNERYKGAVGCHAASTQHTDKHHVEKHTLSRRGWPAISLPCPDDTYQQIDRWSKVKPMNCSRHSKMASRGLDCMSCSITRQSEGGSTNARAAPMQGLYQCKGCTNARAVPMQGLYQCKG